MSGWPNLAELLSADNRDAPVALLGAPLAAGSVTPGSCDLAPELLRRTLRRIGRYDVETGRELVTKTADRGDVDLTGLSIEQATPLVRDAVAASAEAHALTLLVGGWAHAYHLGARASVAQTVMAYRSHLPHRFPLPHPSWRNRAWSARHPWFASEVLPALREQVAAALGL